MESNTYIVSARKYRPDTFESVVGQRALTETLRNSIRQGKLAHAYLFCGPRGVGKTTCARIFAKTINCLSPTPEHEACNACESCRSFNEQRSFNIHELDAASNNSVENIRDLIDQVRIPPQVGKYSVFIIDEVHMLSTGAFNALLKTLEEPPSYAVFILATTEKQKVLPTILSRCQVYDFQRITVEDIIRHLQYVAGKEGIRATEDALNVVAKKADGGMRDALSIFDQLVAFCGNDISYERAIEVLNVLDSDYYFRITELLRAGDVHRSLLLLNEVIDKGFDAGNFMSGLAQHLRDVLMAHDADTAALIETAESVRIHYTQQAATTPAVWIFKALNILIDAEAAYRTSKNKRLTVELMLIRIATLAIAAKDAAAAQPLSKPIQPSTPSQPSAPSQPSMPSQPSQPSRPSSSSQPSMPSSLGIPQLPSLADIGASAESAAPQEQPANAPTPTEPARNNPFTLDQLNGAWIGLKAIFKKEQRLVSMLDAHRPTMIDDHTALVTFVNPWQEEEFKQFRPEITRRLRDTLQNDRFQLRTTVTEHIAVQKAYTAEEKYKLLLEINPYLGEFKKRFNMLLE